MWLVQLWRLIYITLTTIGPLYSQYLEARRCCFCWVWSLKSWSFWLGWDERLETTRLFSVLHSYVSIFTAPHFPLEVLWLFIQWWFSKVTFKIRSISTCYLNHLKSFGTVTPKMTDSIFTVISSNHFLGLSTRSVFNCILTIRWIDISIPEQLLVLSSVWVVRVYVCMFVCMYV